MLTISSIKNLIYNVFIIKIVSLTQRRFVRSSHFHLFVYPSWRGK